MTEQFPEYDLYIAPDGTKLKFGSDDRFVQSYDGYGMAPIKFLTKRGPFQHGKTVVDFRLEQRVIQWLIRQNGCSRFDYWSNRTEFLDYLRANRHATGQFGPGVLRKMLPDGTSRDIDVFISSGPIFASPTGHWDEWGFTEALRFIAPDPTFYNPTLQTVTWSLDPGQTKLEFPITFPIEFTFTGIDQTNSVSYTGTWPSFPGIVITGPLYGFKIENTDTQEIIELNHVIDAGEVVTITLDYGNKTVVSSTLGNIIGTVTLDSDLATFHIAPDPQAASGTNHFHLTGTGADANTQVVLSYYTRYIGI